MNTDQLLQPISMTHSQIIALKEVIMANTEAFREINGDLAKCDNADKVHAVMAKVEMAMQDLSIESQKIPPWVKDVTGIEPTGSSGSEFYGQYPIGSPLNPFNPVPWPPGYVPPASDAPPAQQQSPPVAVAPPPPPVPPPPPPPPPAPKVSERGKR